MNATIYNEQTAEYIAEGLQSSTVSDEAIKVAIVIAKARNKPVILEDDGSEEVLRVYPSGRTEDAKGWYL